MIYQLHISILYATNKTFESLNQSIEAFTRYWTNWKYFIKQKSNRKSAKKKKIFTVKADARFG